MLYFPSPVPIIPPHYHHFHTFIPPPYHSPSPLSLFSSSSLHFLHSKLPAPTSVSSFLLSSYRARRQFNRYLHHAPEIGISRPGRIKPNPESGYIAYTHLACKIHYPGMYQHLSARYGTLASVERKRSPQKRHGGVKT